MSLNARFFYPSLVGFLLGLLQTGLYFELSFTLSSSYTTFLMVTLCWLLGSMLGVVVASRTKLQLNLLLLTALLAYFSCVVILGAAPFDTSLWLVYAVLIVVTALYPGMFFVRLSATYRASTLFFRENNGFIFGLVVGTISFLLLGRIALWVTPVVTAVAVGAVTNAIKRIPMQQTSSVESTEAAHDD